MRLLFLFLIFSICTSIFSMENEKQEKSRRQDENFICPALIGLAIAPRTFTGRLLMAIPAGMYCMEAANNFKAWNEFYEQTIQRKNIPDSSSAFDNHPSSTRT